MAFTVANGEAPNTVNPSVTRTRRYLTAREGRATSFFASADTGCCRLGYILVNLVSFSRSMHFLDNERSVA
jgi:hypothetical protein